MYFYLTSISIPIFFACLVNCQRFGIYDFDEGTEVSNFEPTELGSSFDSLYIKRNTPLQFKRVHRTKPDNLRRRDFNNYNLPRLYPQRIYYNQRRYGSETPSNYVRNRPQAQQRQPVRNLNPYKSYTAYRSNNNENQNNYNYNVNSKSGSPRPSRQPLINNYNSAGPQLQTTTQDYATPPSAVPPTDGYNPYAHPTDGQYNKYTPPNNGYNTLPPVTDDSYNTYPSVTDGSYNTYPPVTDGGYKTYPPVTDDSYNTYPPVTDGSYNTYPPVTDGGYKTYPPVTDDSYNTYPPVTDGGYKTYPTVPTTEYRTTPFISTTTASTEITTLPTTSSTTTTSRPTTTMQTTTRPTTTRPTTTRPTTTRPTTTRPTTTRPTTTRPTTTRPTTTRPTTTRPTTTRPTTTRATTTRPTTTKVSTTTTRPSTQSASTKLVTIPRTEALTTSTTTTPRRTTVIIERVLTASVTPFNPNRVYGKPHIICEEDGIIFSATTIFPFIGQVYALNKRDTPNCIKSYSGQSTDFHITLPYKECGKLITGAREYEPTYTMEVAVEYRLPDGRYAMQLFETQCQNQRIRYDLENIPRQIEEALEELSIIPIKLERKAAMPDCEMRIVPEEEDEHGHHHYGPSNKEPVTGAIIGQKLKVEWSLQPESDAYGFLVKNCFVTDAISGKQHLVIDEKGCSTDLNILGHPHYDTYHDLAIVHWHAFKVPDNAILSIKCEFHICSDIADDQGTSNCQLIPTPPFCPNIVTPSPNSLLVQLEDNPVGNKRRFDKIEVQAHVCLTSNGEPDAKCIKQIENETAVPNALNDEQQYCMNRLTWSLSLAFTILTFICSFTVFIYTSRKSGKHKSIVREPPRKLRTNCSNSLERRDPYENAYIHFKSLNKLYKAPNS